MTIIKTVSSTKSSKPNTNITINSNTNGNRINDEFRKLRVTLTVSVRLQL